MMWSLLLTPLSWLGLVVVFMSFMTYFLLQLLCGTYFRTQNLKRRYQAEWALVTGASSGVVFTFAFMTQRTMRSAACACCWHALPNPDPTGWWLPQALGRPSPRNWQSRG